jgi:hypothetical protein
MPIRRTALSGLVSCYPKGYANDEQAPRQICGTALSGSQLLAASHLTESDQHH